MRLFPVASGLHPKSPGSPGQCKLTCLTAAHQGADPQDAEQPEGRDGRCLHGGGGGDQLLELRPAAGSGSPPPLACPRRCLSAALCLAGASVAGAAIERRIGRQAVAKWLLAPPTSSPGGGRGGRPARRGAELGALRAWCTCRPPTPHPAPHPARTGVAGKCSSLPASRWSPQRRDSRHPETADPRKKRRKGEVRDRHHLHDCSNGNSPGGSIHKESVTLGLTS